MKKTIRIFTAAILLLAMIFICGCSSDNSSAIIYFGVREKPSSIDPQTASTTTELMIVRNLFEGLLRCDVNGNIVSGAAESYTLENGVYTFFLRQNAVWSDGEPVTADDFVFGIQRALDPVTASPNAQLLFPIENARNVHSGSLPTSALGIKAVDANTLIIETDGDENFLYALTTSAAMPCRRIFFEKTKGKYGMSYDTTVSNGTYRLTKWDTENFAMRIYKNEKYQGNFNAKSSAVFLSLNAETDNITLLKKSSVDIAQIETSDVKLANGYGITVLPVENKVLYISFGSGFTDQTVQALKSLINTTSNDDSVYLTANTLFPPLYGENFTKTYNIYNSEQGINVMNSEIKKIENKEFPQKAILYPSGLVSETIVKKIAGHWQQKFGIYMNVSVKESNSEVKSAAAHDKYHIALCTAEITEKNIYSYLKIFDFDYEKQSPDEIQASIFQNGRKIPIAFYCTNIAHTSSISNVYVDSTNGLIDFSYITKSH